METNIRRHKDTRFNVEATLAAWAKKMAVVLRVVNFFFPYSMEMEFRKISEISCNLVEVIPFLAFPRRISEN